MNTDGGGGGVVSSIDMMGNRKKEHGNQSARQPRILCAAALRRRHARRVSHTLGRVVWYCTFYSINDSSIASVSDFTDLLLLCPFD